MLPVSIIIVTWHSEKLLANCLASLAKVYGERPEIIVVDNGNDAEAKAIVTGHSNAKYVASPKNVGFAGGNNLGLPLATRPYILLLNDDTLFHADTLRPMVAFLEAHPKAGIVQGTMNVPGWGNKLDACGSQMQFWGVMRYPHVREDTATTILKPEKVFAVKGALMMFRREVVADAGGFLFYDHFFNYYEETDFCHRAGKAGWECWFVPTPPIDHFGGQSSNRLRSDDVWAQYIANIIFSFRHNFDLFRRLTTLPIFMTGVALRHPLHFLHALRLNRARK